MTGQDKQSAASDGLNGTGQPTGRPKKSGDAPPIFLMDVDAPSGKARVDRPAKSSVSDTSMREYSARVERLEAALAQSPKSQTPAPLAPPSRPNPVRSADPPRSAPTPTPTLPAHVAFLRSFAITTEFVGAISFLLLVDQLREYYRRSFWPGGSDVPALLYAISGVMIVVTASTYIGLTHASPDTRRSKLSSTAISTSIGNTILMIFVYSIVAEWSTDASPIFGYGVSESLYYVAFGGLIVATTFMALIWIAADSLSD